jgi:hypothetical protein
MYGAPPRKGLSWLGMRQGRRLGLAALLGCLALTASAAEAGAAVRHAAVGGAGPEPCAENAPCSLANAVGGASNGDEVVVAPGAYQVPGTGLEISTSIHVHGRPGEAVPVLTQPAAGVPTVRVATLGVALSDLDLRNTAAAGAGNTLDVLPGVVTLDRVTIRHTPPSLAVLVRAGALLQLFNSTVHASGMNAEGIAAAGNLDLVNATVVTTGAGSTAMRLVGTTADPVNASVRNSILDGVALDIHLQPTDPQTATLSIDHSNYNSLLNQNGTVNEGAGNQDSAPLLASPATGDLHQNQGSPTIDAGVTDPDGALDLDAEGRPGGAAPDIGADERYPDGPVRYTAPDAVGRGFCTAPAAACPITRAVEDIPVTGDEVVVLPGTYELTSTLDVATKIDVHGPVDGPRPLITNAFTGGNLVELQAGAGTRLADLRLRNDVDNVVTVLSLNGGGVNIDRVVAIADGSDAHAVLIRAGDTISNSVAWGHGPGALGVSAESTSGGDIPTVRDVTAIAGGPAINYTATGPGNTLVLRNVIARGGIDLQITVDSSGDEGTIDVLFSNFNSVALEGMGTAHVPSSPTNQRVPTPQFVDAANGDFHQLPASPTIDAGFDSAGANGPLDFEGDPRLLGERTDIGADEFRAKPVAITGEVADIGPDRAMLGGGVDPHGLPTTVRFEYGTDASYGSQTAPQDAGGGNAAVTFSAAVSGLSPSTTYHYRAVAANSGGTSVGDDKTFTTAPPPPVVPGDHTAPVVSAFAASNTTFRVGMPAAVGRRRAPVGTRFSYRVSEDARVTITIARQAQGRRVGRRCVKPTRRNRARKRCTRFVRAGALGQDVQAGANSRTFSGRFGRKRLPPARYRATLVAVDRAGNRSIPRQLRLRVVR